MSPRILILAAEGFFSEAINEAEFLQAVNGEGVAGLSLLYTILKERQAPLLLVADDFPGINPVTLRKIRMRAPQMEIHRLVKSDREVEPDENFDGTIYLGEGIRGVGGRVKRILSQQELLGRYGMVGHSEKMKVVAETISRIAPTDISVLIIGPSGTGKELVARAVHNNSGRSERRFVAINCGALASGVLESELFGHEKGAFTGSVGKREGLFKQADGGTIFLDEIGETRPDMQVKLLRVLEDGVFYPVGGDSPVHADVRVLAATNRDLVEAIGEGDFREDLYFRLGVVKISLPPLHDRKGDIIPLLYYFAEKSKLKDFSERAIDLLTRYDWPGNIRQLRNFVDRMGALHPGDEVSLGDVEQFITEQGFERKNLPVITGHTRDEAGQELVYHALLQLGQEVRMLRELIVENLPSKEEFEVNTDENNHRVYDDRALSMENMEKDIIEKALRQSGGNRKKAARKLGIGERTLYRKLKKFSLN